MSALRSLAAMALLALALPAAAEPVLAPVWSDGVVVQRGREIVVQGKAAPGARVEGTLGDTAATALADAAGTFRLAFPAREASADPLMLSVRDAGGSVVVGNIVVGDVYLCSGQSNMAYTVAAGLNGWNNVRASEDPLLRMLTVPTATASVPASEFAGPTSWQAASPETTGSFSAACYYMLRDLRRDLGVPVGAVHASWGGSQIRPWLTPEGGAALYGAEQMELLARQAEDPLAAVAAFAPLWQDWWRAEAGNTPWSDPDVLEWRAVPAIAPWTSWDDGPPAVGNVWFRHTIELTAEQAAAGGELNIGIVDDLDATWVNGRAVGFSHGWDTERRYAVPGDYLREGANEIVFAASNSWDRGGMQSAVDRLSFTPAGMAAIPLAAGWRYATTPVTAMPPRAPWDANAGIGVMHNRMVAPVGQFALAGAAWYQGESDVGLPGYGDRLRELFAGWRAQFGEDLRVMVVQLANYGPVASAPVESGWADLREVERQAVLADANAALVTAIDIGEASDIHPSNKVTLGQRLALAARGDGLPMPVAALTGGEVPAGWLAVRFAGVEGDLVSLSGPALAFELCGEGEGTCRYAPGTVSGNAVLLPTDGAPVSRVRYAWADSPVVNTQDARGAALPGFEIAVSE